MARLVLLADAPAPPPESVSLLRICASLAYINVIGFTALGIPLVVIPREVSLFTADAAAIVAGLNICNCVAAMLAPFVGVWIDRTRNHWPHKIIAGGCATIGVALMIVAFVPLLFY